MDQTDKDVLVKRSKHPNFILGAVSFLLLFIGIGMKAYGYREGDYVIIGSVVLGGIHWIWCIFDVFKHQSTESQSKVFWVILVVLIPAVGSMLYYSMSKTFRM